MSRKDLIFEIDRQLLDNDHIILDKEEAKEIIKNLKGYDEIYKEMESKKQFKHNLYKEIKYHLELIEDTKINHLLLADDNEYHRHRYLVEKEKQDLLENLLKFIYNQK